MIHDTFAFLKKELLSVRTLAVVLAVPFLLLADRSADIAEILGEGAYSGFSLFMVQLGLEDRSMRLFFPLLCTLPGAAEFILDRRCGISRLILARTGRRTYAAARTIACGLAGGISAVLGIAAASALSLAILGSMEPVFDMGELSYYAGYIAVLAGMYLLSGYLWSVFGMLMSIYTNSRYIAHLSPFAAYYLLVLLQERYFRGFGLVNPGAWIVPEKFGLYGRTGMVACCAAGLCVIVTIAACAAAGRSLKDV